ncbi:RNA polymerase sigma factor [Streptomyces massasporeus]|uniref:RNA polymerase sigma factor n=1 Tax=Streptomyces massasporeus TaxID=67324 RepID=UPI0037B0B782
MKSIEEHKLAVARERRFEDLAQAVLAPLRRYLVRRTDAGSVDDILAETMLVLWRRLDDIPGFESGSGQTHADVLPWCYGVARGCLANARRADGRRLRLVERLSRTASSNDQWHPPGHEHAELYAALRTLKAVDREVVLLWAWEGLTAREIADATESTPNAVSIRLHRAKKKLAALLERQNGALAAHKTDEGQGRSD